MEQKDRLNSGTEELRSKMLKRNSYTQKKGSMPKLMAIMNGKNTV